MHTLKQATRSGHCMTSIAISTFEMRYKVKTHLRSMLVPWPQLSMIRNVLRNISTARSGRNPAPIMLMRPMDSLLTSTLGWGGIVKLCNNSTE